MHHANVLEFPPPESHLGFVKHSYDDPKLDSTYKRLIDEHPFNTMVNITLPGIESVPQKLMETLVYDKEFYKVENLLVSEFCMPTFLQAFMKTGNFFAVSCETRLDLDNVAALTPDGWLVLLLDQFTYKELRLSGKLSAHILRRPKERYIVKINLKENFIPGKPYYHQVVNAFKQISLGFSFWITWLPDDADVCPSSIAKYFHERGFNVIQEEVSVHSKKLQDIAVPLLEDSMKIEPHTNVEVDPETILEWIGCTSLGIKLPSEGSSVSDVISPKPNRSLENTCTINSSGFFVPSHVRLLIEELRLLLDEISEDTLPWVSLTIYGHVDSPVTWNLTENSFFTNGDNICSLVIMRSQVWLYRVSGARKPLRVFEKCNNNK